MKLSPVMKGILAILGLIILIRMFAETPEQAMYRQLEEQNQVMQQQNMQMYNDMTGQSQMMQQQMQQDMQSYNGMNQMPGYSNQNGYNNSNIYRSGGRQQTPEILDEDIYYDERDEPNL